DFGQYDLDPVTAEVTQLTGAFVPGIGFVIVPHMQETAPAAKRNDVAVVGGGQLGLNLQFGHFVLGADSDFQGASHDETVRFDAPTPNTAIGNPSVVQFRRDISTAWLASVRGRLGLAWNRLLIYATGGVAFADLTLETRDMYAPTFGGVFGATNPNPPP